MYSAIPRNARNLSTVVRGVIFTTAASIDPNRPHALPVDYHVHKLQARVTPPGLPKLHRTPPHLQAGENRSHGGKLTITKHGDRFMPRSL